MLLPIPVSTLKTYASTLFNLEKLINRTNNYYFPVISTKASPPASEILSPEELKWSTGPDEKALLGRDFLQLLYKNTSRTLAEYHFRTKDSITHISLQPTVYTVEGDPASLVAVAVAAYTGRPLEVIEPLALAEVATWATAKRFTLVASAAAISYFVMEALLNLNRKNMPDAAKPFFAIMTGSRLSTISNLAYRTLTFEPSSQSPIHKTLLVVAEEIAGSLPPVPFAETLINPTKEKIQETFLTEDIKCSTVSFFNHGREYCGRMGEGALCAQGEEGHQENQCLDGMTCFDKSWLRLSPQHVKADLVFVNSCSVLKPARTFFDYKRTLGLEFVEENTCGLIAPFLVENSTTFDNYLFHTLAHLGFKLADIAFLLNQASYNTRQLVAIGDCEFSLYNSPPATALNPIQLVSTGAGLWEAPATTLSLKNDSCSLTEFLSPELYRAALQGEMAFFKEDGSETGSINSKELLGAIFPGVEFPQTFMYVAGSKGEEFGLKLVKRDQASVQKFSQRLEHSYLYLMRLRGFYKFEKYPHILSQIEEQLIELTKAYHGYWSSMRRDIIAFKNLEFCQQILEELEAIRNKTLAEVLSKNHCGEMIFTALLNEQTRSYGKSCPNCGEGIALTSQASLIWPHFSLFQGICPVCGIIFMRSSNQVELVVQAKNNYWLNLATTIKLKAQIFNKSDTNCAGYIALSLIPKVPDLQELRSPEPLPFEVKPGASQLVDFEIEKPSELPRNVYVVQLTGAHQFGVDYACRYIRIF